MLDREVATFYLELMIEVCLRNWFPIIDEDTFVDSPKPQLVQEKDKKKILSEQSKETSLEVIVNGQFINEPISALY